MPRAVEMEIRERRRKKIRSRLMAFYGAPT